MRINEWRQLDKRMSFGDIGGACLSTRACLDVYGSDFRGCVPGTSDRPCRNPTGPYPRSRAVISCRYQSIIIRAEAMAEVQGHKKIRSMHKERRIKALIIDELEYSEEFTAASKMLPVNSRGRYGWARPAAPHWSALLYST